MAERWAGKQVQAAHHPAGIPDAVCLSGLQPTGPTHRGVRGFVCLPRCVGLGLMTSTNKTPRMTECWSDFGQGIHPGGSNVLLAGWLVISLV